MEVQKAAKLDQLTEAKARKADNDTHIEADKDHAGFHSSTEPPVQPSNKPLSTNPASLNQLPTTS
jgi:hypothetical protein